MFSDTFARKMILTHARIIKLLIVVLFSKEIRCQTRGFISPHTISTDETIGLTSYAAQDSPHCQPNEYGPSCKYCVPRDSCVDGHYTCDPLTGNKLCRPGYKGVACEIPEERDTENEFHLTCPASECRNGGTCISGRCCCSGGYTGELCEVEIIECRNDSCMNAGICKDLIGGFACLCQHGFTGNRCELSSTAHAQTTPSLDSDCQSGSCLNKGRCFEIGDSVFCVCPKWFTGQKCEIDLRTSLHNLTACPENLYGSRCQTECEARDTCNDGHFMCNPENGGKVCDAGWSGPNCDIRHLPSQIDPECGNGLACNNGGQCFHGGCCCRHSFKGQYCEIAIGCSSGPCHHNATCVDHDQGYVCICDKRYTGHQCENKVNQHVVVTLAYISPQLATESTFRGLTESQSLLTSSTDSSKKPTSIKSSYVTKSNNEPTPEGSRDTPSFVRITTTTTFTPTILTNFDSSLITSTTIRPRTSSETHQKSDTQSPSNLPITINELAVTSSHHIATLTDPVLKIYQSELTIPHLRSSDTPSSYTTCFSECGTSDSTTEESQKHSYTATRSSLIQSSVLHVSTFQSFGSYSLTYAGHSNNVIPPYNTSVNSQENYRSNSAALVQWTYFSSTHFTTHGHHPLKTDSPAQLSASFSFTRFSNNEHTTSTAPVSNPSPRDSASTITHLTSNAASLLITANDIDTAYGQLSSAFSTANEKPHAVSSTVNMEKISNSRALVDTSLIQPSYSSDFVPNLPPISEKMTLTFTQRVQNEKKSEIVISSILQTSSIINSPHIQTRTAITNHNHNVLSTQMQPIKVSKSCSDWSSNCVAGVIVDMPPGSEEPEVPKGPPNDTANKEGRNFPWVAVVFGILGLVIIATVVVTTVSVLRRKRKRASRTLRNSPDEVIDFDREHFSVQPEFTNPSYGIEHDDDDGIKHDIYVVND